MVRSMTAFARHGGEGDWGKAVWEIRSVNHRYLDLALRLPEDLRALETPVRERVIARLRRGKVDCTLRFQSAAADAGLQVNLAALERLGGALARVAERIPTAAGADPIEILRWPGVVDAVFGDAERSAAPLLELLDTALEQLVATRAREGERLRELLTARCAQARAEVRSLRTRMPAILEEIRERLRARIAELGAELDPGRVEQEMVLLVAKLDVAEELDRLDAHLDEVERLLEADDPIGRRLDFLMQELNREANTLGAKSAHLATTGASVELKVLIEQMREQIQNVE